MSPGSQLYEECSAEEFGADVDQLVLSQAITQDTVLSFKYSIWTEDNPLTSIMSKDFSIQARYCPMTMPEFKPFYEYDLASDEPLIISVEEADNGSCGYTCTFGVLPGEPFSLASEPGRRRRGMADEGECKSLIVSPSTDRSLVNSVFAFTFTLESTREIQEPKSVSFEVNLTSSAAYCEAQLQIQ